MIIVSLALATICFAGQCHPILVGKDTPTGTYQLQQRYVLSPGYGGDVLQFKEDEKAVYAIHRTWTLRPAEKREERIKSSSVKQRFITKGCINVEPAVYEQLVDCCSQDQLRIE